MGYKYLSYSGDRTNGDDDGNNSSSNNVNGGRGVRGIGNNEGGNTNDVYCVNTLDVLPMVFYWSKNCIEARMEFPFLRFKHSHS